MRGSHKRMKKEEDQSRNTLGMTVNAYTDQLPELVIEHIISFLSTKSAVRASVLSKEWSRLCSSAPVLDFDEDEGHEKQCTNDWKRRSMFIKFLSNRLKLHEKVKHLDKFRLRMSYFGRCSAVDKWLSFALEKNVKELDVCFRRGVRSWTPYYSLTQTALIKNAKSLIVLKLENVKIEEDTIDPVSLPSLKTMSLKTVKFMTKPGFSRLISGYPSVEYLSLTSCHGWDVRLSSSKLKHLEIMSCEAKFKLEVTNLVSFKVRGDNGLRHHIIDTRVNFPVTSSHTLRNLEFFHTHFAGRWFEGLDSRFPLLERLALHTCSGYSGRIRIYSQHLKHFVFSECGNIMSNFSITAPNLSDATITVQEGINNNSLITFL